MTIRKPPLLAGAALIAMAAPAAAKAQEARPTALSEIVVTAQKRAENIQDVPISIAAVAGERVESAGVSTPQDLARLAPGLTIGTTGGNSATFAYIRGGGTNLIDISADPSVATFVDEIYVPGTSGMQFGLLDIERVEVLKGPQGTLFGRNAAAGAISIHTRRPSAEQSGTATLEAGNHGFFLGRASVTGPLTADGAFQYRLSGLYRHRDPVTENYAGADPGEVNAVGARAQLEYEGEAVTILGTLGFSETDNGPADIFTFTEGFLGSLIDNPSQLPSHPNKFFKVWRNRPGGHDFQRIWEGNVRVEADTPLGQLTSISAWRDSRFKGRDDRDGTFADALELDYIEAHETISQEVRLANDWERLQTLVGAYFFRDKGFNNQSYVTRPDMALYPDSRDRTLSDIHRLTVESVAVFGQATYDVTDRLSVTVGGRWTHDKKSSDRIIDVDAVAPFFLFPVGSYTVEVGDKWRAFTPMVTAQYELAPDVMLYGSVRSGFKSGGFQTLLPSTPDVARQTYDPEKVLSYEAGLRSQWLDRRLLLNVSAFHVEMKDQQVSIFEGGALSVRNAARSKTYGVDLEVKAQPTPELTLAWSATAQKARFGRYQYISPFTGPVDNSGNNQLRSPDFATTLAADYVVPLANGAEVALHADYFFQTRVYFDDANYRFQPSTYQKAYGVLNARLGYRAASGRWDVSVWGRNLADEHYCVNIIVWATPAPGAGACSPGEPRSYGLTLTSRF